MKRLLLILAGFLFVTSASAYDTTWNFSQQNPEWVAGFKAKYGVVKGGPYNLTYDCKKPSPKVDKTYDCIVSGLTAKTFYGIVVNYDSAGIESAPSNEFMFTAQTPPPADLKIVLTITTVSKLNRFGKVVASTTRDRKSVPTDAIIKEGTTEGRNKWGEWVSTTTVTLN